MFCLYCGLEADADYIWKHMERCKNNPSVALHAAREAIRTAEVRVQQIVYKVRHKRCKKHVRKVRVLGRVQQHPVQDKAPVNTLASAVSLEELRKLAQQGFGLK